MDTIKKPEECTYADHNKHPGLKKSSPPHRVKDTEYYCPMHCEGDKTYDKPGDCPKCGMDMKKREKKKKLAP